MSFIVKKTTFSKVFDMICPHSCRRCGVIGEVLCECCKNDLFLEHENYCPNCKYLILRGACQQCQLPPTFLVGWRDELIGKLVYDFKYNSVRALGEVLAEILDQILPIVAGKVVIVPLPTIAKHVRKRGLDHTFMIAKSLAKRRKWETQKLLRRVKNTVQVGANEATRKKQAEEAYEFVGIVDKENTYILFDDVWTTGASMKVAIQKMQKAGISKIIVVILATNRLRRK